MYNIQSKNGKRLLWKHVFSSIQGQNQNETENKEIVETAEFFLF